MTPQQIIDKCAAMDVELSDWQQKWIHNWIAAGRPRRLSAQYEQSWRKPVDGTRKVDTLLRIN